MIERFKKAFFAYPGAPSDLVSTINAAASATKGNSQKVSIVTWPEMGVFGANIPDVVRDNITTSDATYCDITIPNLNVYYEAAFAIGEGKAIAPVLNRSFAGASSDLQKDGIFDNIGYKSYENTPELSKLLLDIPDTSLLDLYAKPINYGQPIFLLTAKNKTDFINSVVSSVKAERIFYRSFDPVEISRFSSIFMIGEITSSAGVIIPVLAPHVDDADRHNLRAAFIAGLAHGLGKPTLILQLNRHDTTGPADYRDLIENVRNQEDITEQVGNFVRSAVLQSHSGMTRPAKRQRTALQKLTLGSSAAENEFRTLESYFVETSEFVRTRRGEVSVVAGRKGSGKTAIFFMVRDDHREDKNSIVVDLKPESHQLSTFRQELFTIVGAGVFEHTLAAFWYFVILSEIALTIREKLAYASKYDGRALAGMREIDESLETFRASESGDFTSRINRLGTFIIQEIEIAKGKNKTINPDSLTNVVFKNGISALKKLLASHTTNKSNMVFLFDNIDKGWPSNGVDKLDVRMVRLLLESLDKVRRDFSAMDRDFMSVVFLRNDIYELLVDDTPDRGKAAQLRIDWTDRIKLRQVIYRRLQASTNDKTSDFDTLWHRFFETEVNGKDSFEYLVDHCLMRPRFLITIVENAVANGINRGHSVVTADDCMEAVRQHSNYLIDDFGFEIRDVSGLPEDILYALVGAQKLLTKGEVIARLESFVTDHAQKDEAFRLMLWYGVIGVVDKDNKEKYIYDFDYNMRRLEAEVRTLSGEVLYVTNPAIQVAL